MNTIPVTPYFSISQMRFIVKREVGWGEANGECACIGIYHYLGAAGCCISDFTAAVLEVVERTVTPPQREDGD